MVTEAWIRGNQAPPGRVACYHGPMSLPTLPTHLNFYGAHQHALRTQSPNPASLHGSWLEQKQAMEAWWRWERLLLDVQRGELAKHNPVSRAAVIVREWGRLRADWPRFEHQTWQDQSQEFENTQATQCVWHDPLAVAIVKAHDQKQLGLAGVLTEVVATQVDPSAVALTWRVEDQSWDVGYQPLLMLLLCNAQSNELFRGLPYPDDYNIPEVGSPQWQSYLKASVLSEHPEFWRPGLNQAMDALMEWGMNMYQGAAAGLGLLHVLGAVPSQPVRDALLSPYTGTGSVSALQRGLFKAMNRSALADRYNRDLPEGVSSASKPRF